MRGIVDESTDSAIRSGGAPAFGRSAVPDPLTRPHPQHGNVSYVRLEIRTDTLYSLINNRVLVIEDLRGLDRQAKSWIRKRLLDALTTPLRTDVTRPLVTPNPGTLIRKAPG